MNTNYNTINIGHKLRKFRTEKGYSQEYMADRLKISQKTYSNMENEKTEITIDTLKQIADELEIDLLELLSDGKIIVQYNTSTDTSTFNGVVNNNMSEELINQLKERIEDLKSQIKMKDEIIFILKSK